MSTKAQTSDKAFAYENNQKDHWLTPPALIEACGPFELDPCAGPAQPWKTAALQYALPETNGLLMPWPNGCVWCNPPYGNETGHWLQRMALHNNGLMLIFARTDTIAFRVAWNCATASLFFYGRISFYRADGTPSDGGTAPSVLLAFGAGNIERLERAKKKYKDGALVTKWEP